MVNKKKYIKAAQAILDKYGVDCRQNGLYGSEEDTNGLGLMNYLYMEGYSSTLDLAQRIGIDLSLVDAGVRAIIRTATARGSSQITDDEIMFIRRCQLASEICIWLDRQVRMRVARGTR